MFANGKMLEKALSMAVLLHDGQRDMQRLPSVTHPLSVMCRLLAKGITDEETLVASLYHDVPEDCHKKFGGYHEVYNFLINRGVSPAVIEALVLLTHVEDDLIRQTREERLAHYYAYVKRIKDSGNPIAIQVKIADLEDNTSQRRLGRITDPETRAWFIEKYGPAYRMLTDKELEEHI